MHASSFTWHKLLHFEWDVLTDLVHSMISVLPYWNDLTRYCGWLSNRLLVCASSHPMIWSRVKAPKCPLGSNIFAVVQSCISCKLFVNNQTKLIFTKCRIYTALTLYIYLKRPFLSISINISFPVSFLVRALFQNSSNVLRNKKKYFINEIIFNIKLC